jgi:protein-L-isoaspartate(D-aspartate) O-methyltransferase
MRSPSRSSDARRQACIWHFVSLMHAAKLVPLVAAVLTACTRSPSRAVGEAGTTSATIEPPVRSTDGGSASVESGARDPEAARSRRASLVSSIAESGHVKSERVLDAMRRVPRHLFVPAALLEEAYGDWPLPIGSGQTISQPSVVGMMTEALELRGTERVLEIGTGSGYQAAVLSVLARDVYTIEIVRELGVDAEKRLRELDYTNVHVRIGDGYAGWPEEAPFDRVILTAAPPEVPKALLDQLADDGILVAPVGKEQRTQWLVRMRKKDGKLTTERLELVRFVPMRPAR